MRVLLDENLPVGLAHLLGGHDVATVAGLEWQGVSNGELLSRMEGDFDALVTMDHGLPHQQNLSGRSFAVVLLRSSTSRLADLRPLVPALLDALAGIEPGAIRSVGA